LDLDLLAGGERDVADIGTMTLTLPVNDVPEMREAGESGCA